MVAVVRADPESRSKLKSPNRATGFRAEHGGMSGCIAGVQAQGSLMCGVVRCVARVILDVA